MTHLTGLIGYPVSHSKSSSIHAYWMAQHRLNAEYKLFTTPPNRVRQVVHRLRDKGALGFNVTVPHKLAVMEYLDEIDATAKTIGAVNTVVRMGDKLIGHNTDAYGCITNLSEGLGDVTPYLNQVVMLGAGGAARAAIVALKEAGAASITLTNRSQDKAEALAAEFGCTTKPWGERHHLLQGASLLINTTSLGMHGSEALEIDLAALPIHAAVHDIVYAPLETDLLKAAKARGNPVVDGLGMLLYQAQKSFALWHGVLPEVTPALRAHVLEGHP
jgi:shikimate dehydrogenase